MEDRITEIEIALAHQEVEIEKLNDVIRQQWREIDRLKSQMVRSYLQFLQT